MPAATPETLKAVRAIAAGKRQIVPEEATRLVPRTAREPRPNTGREWELESWANRVRAAEDLPPEVPAFTLGTLRRDTYLGDLAELRRVPIVNLTLVEPCSSKPAAIVEKYKGWLKQGAAPISVTEHESGRLIVSNGHHRACAALAAGKKSIPAWVSMTWNKPDERRPDLHFPRGVTEAQAKCLAKARDGAAERACLHLSGVD